MIWTTTPWTLPGNRAISFSPKIKYGLYKVTEAPADNWTKAGDLLVLADKLAADVFKQAQCNRFRKSSGRQCRTNSMGWSCAHPLEGKGGYDFAVPLLPGDHVTDTTAQASSTPRPVTAARTSTSGPPTARRWKRAASIRRSLTPSTKTAPSPRPRPASRESASSTTRARRATPTRRSSRRSSKPDMLIARGRLKHQYPHSWRSKKPIIFRNTPQWFIAMDKDIAKRGDTLRARALPAIKVTRWVPEQGQNRITGMIESRPDWVISRQRAWGVPIAVFVKEKPDGSVDILRRPGGQRAHRRGLRGRRRRRLVQAGRARALPRQARQRRLEKGRRHSRRLVRFRLDPRLRAGGPGAFPARSPASSARSTAAKTP